MKQVKSVYKDGKFVASDKNYATFSHILLKINDAFKKIIIVKDYIKRTRNENGIITMSIFDFLLDPDSLDY